QGSCDFAVVSQICMRTVPEVSGNHNGIDSLPSPPGTLIAAPMQLSVVEPADGNGEPVADFPPHRPLLSELDVMGIGRRAPADEALLGGHKSEVIAIALTYGFADDVDRLLA